MRTLILIAMLALTVGCGKIQRESPAATTSTTNNHNTTTQTSVSVSTSTTTDTSTGTDTSVATNTQTSTSTGTGTGSDPDSETICSNVNGAGLSFRFVAQVFDNEYKITTLCTVYSNAVLVAATSVTLTAFPSDGIICQVAYNGAYYKVEIGTGGLHPLSEVQTGANIWKGLSNLNTSGDTFVTTIAGLSCETGSN